MSAFYVFVYADPHECTYNRRGQQMCVSWIMCVNLRILKFSRLRGYLRKAFQIQEQLWCYILYSVQGW